MEFKIIAPGGDQIQMAHELRTLPKIQKLFGAELIGGSAQFGDIIFQNYKGEGFAIWYSNYNIRHDTKIIGRADIAVLELHIQFRSQFTNEWDGFDKNLLHPYQYNLSYTPHVNNSATFLADHDYHTFDIHFTFDYLKQFASCSTALNHFLDKVTKAQATSISAGDRFLTPEMIAIVNQILNCNLSSGLNHFLIDAKVKELLTLVLDQVAGVHPLAPIKLSDYDIEKLHEAKAIILADFEDKISLSQLSRKIALNEYKLKKGFKYLFGTTVFGYRHTARMDRAKLLILETKTNINDIAYMTGFDHPSNFQKAFKKHFNFTIAELKKYGNT